MRNLGFAYKELPDDASKLDEEIETDFVFVGIMSMIDPPRTEVKDAIALCKSAGIRVVMITGDHKLTATAIAKALNLLDEKDAEGKVLTGSELEGMTDDQLDAIVEKVVVYARVSPEHKMRIVKAWKKKDEVVAMTGDGVNDAPALKMSDIGIAMGISGTEVTKEAADMVLADDNFASIVKAVREGREIYDNIKEIPNVLAAMQHHGDSCNVFCSCKRSIPCRNFYFSSRRRISEQRWNRINCRTNSLGKLSH